MLILNLGCGTRTSEHCKNIDWGVYVRLRNNPLARIAAGAFISAERRKKLNSLSGNVLVHDMRKGLPFETGSVDAIYHSHMLEHIDREYVPGFHMELLRVLKPQGIQRICVPDLEFAASCYFESVRQCEADPSHIPHHDRTVDALLEQSVRKEASGTSMQPGWRRFLENKLLGDARRRGETHQWMYDRFNLRHILEQAGFGNVVQRAWNESAIANWQEIGLEVDDLGGEYKPHSLYMEAQKTANGSGS